MKFKLPYVILKTHYLYIFLFAFFSECFHWWLQRKNVTGDDLLKRKKATGKYICENVQDINGRDKKLTIVSAFPELSSEQAAEWRCHLFISNFICCRGLVYFLWVESGSHPCFWKLKDIVCSPYCSPHYVLDWRADLIERNFCVLRSRFTWCLSLLYFTALWKNRHVQRKKYINIVIICHCCCYYNHFFNKFSVWNWYMIIYNLLEFAILVLKVVPA